MSTLADLHAALEEFNGMHPGVPPLQISEPYVLDRDWPTKWTYSDDPGVYILLGEQDEVMRVGRGRPIGRRLGGYFKYGPNREAEALDPQYEVVVAVVTIRVPHERDHDLDALEAFLIEKLDPP